MGLKFTPDRTVLEANGQDLAFITLEAVDQKGSLQMNASQEVHFSLSGAATIAAIGNGDGESN